MTDAEIADKQKELATIQAFMQTPAYRDFLADIQAQLEAAEVTINNMPTNLEDLIAREQSHGAKAVLKDLPDWFSDRSSLIEEDLKLEVNKHKLPN